jgi:PD-(D/E)XK nuclease superfamily
VTPDGPTMLPQVGRGLRHAPAQARRTKASTLAAQGDDLRLRTCLAREQRGTSTQHTAIEKPLELAPDEVRQRRRGEAVLDGLVAPAGAEEVEVAPIAWKAREGRYGAVFGLTVHRALQLVLTKRVSAEVAVGQAAAEHGHAEQLDVALEDVRRTHAALRDAGLLEHPLRVEHPIAGSLEPGTLLSGYVDLLVASPETLMVIDFKTDAPPRGDLESGYPGYVEQARAYLRLLEGAGVAGSRTVRAALLFTAEGALRWV